MNIKMSDVSILFSRCLYFLSSGMDSNSQTSQELLIPNDVRRSNSKLSILHVVSIFPSEQQGKKTSHMYAAQEQVTSDAAAAATAKTSGVTSKETRDMLATY